MENLTGHHRQAGGRVMTRHAILQAARRTEPCAVDGATPGHPCDCAPGVHLCRIFLCADHQHITLLDAVSVIPDADQFSGRLIVLDEVTP